MNNTLAFEQIIPVLDLELNPEYPWSQAYQKKFSSGHSVSGLSQSEKSAISVHLEQDFDNSVQELLRQWKDRSSFIVPYEPVDAELDLALFESIIRLPRILNYLGAATPKCLDTIKVLFSKFNSLKPYYIDLIGNPLISVNSRMNERLNWVFIMERELLMKDTTVLSGFGKI